MAPETGSGVRNPALRRPGNPDPIHSGRYMPFAPVDGRGGTNISGPYEPVVGWPAPTHDPTEWRTGSGRGIIAESPDRIIACYGGEVPAYEEKSVWGVDVFRDLRFTEINGRKNPGHRHCHEIVIYDREGTPVETWDHWLDALHENDVAAGKKPKSGHVNRLRMNRYDPEGHIWIVGLSDNGVFKFTNDGRSLALKVDSRNVPEDLHQFIYAQDVAFLPNGDFFVGHLHHIMRFSKDGEFQWAVGGQGYGPGEFDGIHDLHVDPTTLNLFVNDRVNGRMQILDQEGRFLDQWQGFQGIYAIRFTEDGKYMWAANGFVHKFLKYDMGGHLIPEATWGTFGIAPGAIWCPHAFDIDVEGNLYIAEDYSGRVQKLRPMEGTSPTDPQLIGPLIR